MTKWSYSDRMDNDGKPLATASTPAFAEQVAPFPLARLEAETGIPRSTLRRKIAAGVGAFTVSELFRLARATGGDVVAWVAAFVRIETAAR